MGEFDDLFLGEVASDAAAEIVGDGGWRNRKRLGVLNDKPFDLGQLLARLPVGDGVNGFLIKTQLTAECSSEIVSPQATNHRRRPKLGNRFGAVIDGATESNPALHRQLPEQGGFVPGSGLVRAWHDGPTT